MSLTVRTHSATTYTPPSWSLLASDRPGYAKFSAVMPQKERSALLTKIIILSVITFGIYYLCLLCTKHLSNLKNRIMIHYIPSRAKNVTNAKRLEPFTIPDFSQKVIKGAFAKGLEQAKAFRQIAQDISEIIKNKKELFLFELHNKNPDLACKLEEYFSKPDEGQRQSEFLAIVNEFLDMQDAQELLKSVVASVKAADPRQTTAGQKAFAEFMQAFLKLPSELDWQFSLQNSPEQLALACDLLDSRYHLTHFLKIYDNDPAAIQALLKTMQNVPVASAIQKKDIETKFETCKRLREKLFENIALRISPHDTREVYYSMNSYLYKKDIYIAEIEEFKNATEWNKINPKFVHLYLQKKIERYLQGISNLLDTHKHAAEKKCQKLIAKFPLHPVKTSDVYKTPEVLQAFKKITELQQNSLEVLQLLAELRYFLSDVLFQKQLFDFANDVVVGKFADQPTYDFYKKFHPYFRNIDAYKEVINQINA